MRIMCPLVVVPNPELMDNHQLELAETMAQFDYLVHGQLDNLEQALDDAAVLAEKRRKNPNLNSGEEEKGLVAGGGESMGARQYADYEVPWTE